MINTPDEEHVPVPGIDVPNYGAKALHAQKEGKRLPPPETQASEPESIGGFPQTVDATGANAIQHGGDHYQKKTYQHWDFVCDTGMHYLLACATKYVSRWQDKGGVEDLRKAAHYLDKALERGITMSTYSSYHVNLFTSQLDSEEAAAVQAICANDHNGARWAIAKLIGSATLVQE